MKELLTETKECSACKTEKSFESFYKRPTGACYPICKACHTIKSKAWAAKNPEKCRSSQHKYNQKFKKEQISRTEKACTSCGQIKSLDQFWGRSSKCKICRTAQCKKWATENRDKTRAYSRNYMASNPERRRINMAEYRAAHRGITNEMVYKYRKNNPSKIKKTRLKSALKRRYGLTLEQFESMMHKQNGKCAACGDTLEENDFKCVDHCHHTGVVRGILCQACNWAEGHLKTPARAFALYKYMNDNELFYYGRDTQTDYRVA